MAVWRIGRKSATRAKDQDIGDELRPLLVRSASRVLTIPLRLQGARMRKPVLALLFLSLCLPLFAQDQKAPTLKSILLEQLRTTHNQKDWFVDANTAVAGLTPEQASWTDGKGNHSVGQLAN